ncbi:MAG: hypothetical protein LAO07_03265 [Acidobacteriia bacterium]|nr:hypothetical protein [Terriglobia bacterium]
MVSDKVDLALWDITGKALGRPVHELMGGPRREHVVPYASARPPLGTLAETERRTRQLMDSAAQTGSLWRLSCGFRRFAANWSGLSSRRRTASSNCPGRPAWASNSTTTWSADCRPPQRRGHDSSKFLPQVNHAPLTESPSSDRRLASPHAFPLCQGPAG